MRWLSSVPMASLASAPALSAPGPTLTLIEYFSVTSVPPSPW